MTRAASLAAVATAAALLLPAPPAHANGRFPTTTSITFRPGEGARDLYLGVTFGLLISHDDGAHWYWACEQSIGYGGNFDPKYAVAADGTLYATTFTGLRVSRDGGCTFTTATAAPDGGGELVDKWVDAIDVAPDGTVWIGTADSGLPNAIWRSTDQGRTATKMGLDSTTVWWKSIKVAPTQPQRIYVSGYQVMPSAQVFLYRSDDGGTTWTPLPTADITLGARPVIYVDAVDPTNPDILYVRSTGAQPPTGDRIFRSADGGMTWTDVVDPRYPTGQLTVRANGDVVVGTVQSEETPKGCTYRSTDRGVTFSACELGPAMACVHEREGGTLYACGANWDDQFALATSTDAATWTKVMRFHEMAGPLACPAGTVQHDTCEVQLWPSIAAQFGVMQPDAGVDGPPVDAGNGADGGSGGCCDAGGGEAAGIVLLAIVVGGFLVWRGRRKKKACCR